MRDNASAAATMAFQAATRNLPGRRTRHPPPVAQIKRSAHDSVSHATHLVVREPIVQNRISGSKTPTLGAFADSGSRRVNQASLLSVTAHFCIGRGCCGKGVQQHLQLRAAAVEQSIAACPGCAFGSHRYGTQHARAQARTSHGV